MSLEPGHLGPFGSVADSLQLESVGIEPVGPETMSPGSNNIAVTADIHDMDGAQALMDSPPPEIAALMEVHGVVPPFTAYIEVP